MIPEFSKVAKNIGVGVETIGSNKHSDMMTLMRPFDAQETAYMQASVEDIYELFVNLVANSRGMEPEKVDEIAQGRVWAATDALQIGLVDEFGGIREAVSWVANKAKLGKDYKTQNYPAIEDQFMAMLDKYMVTSYESRMKGEMGLLYDCHKQLQRIMGRDQILCLMPEGEIEF